MILYIWRCSLKIPCSQVSSISHNYKEENKCSQNFWVCLGCQHQGSAFMGNFPHWPSKNSDQTLPEGALCFRMKFAAITSPSAKLGLPCPGSACHGTKLRRAKVIPELWLMQISGCYHWTGVCLSLCVTPLWCGGQKCSSKEPHAWLTPQTEVAGRVILQSLYTSNCIYNALR